MMIVFNHILSRIPIYGISSEEFGADDSLVLNS